MDEFSTMSPLIQLQLDPDFDTELVLENPNSQVLQWHAHSIDWGLATSKKLKKKKIRAQNASSEGPAVDLESSVAAEPGISRELALRPLTHLEDNQQAPTPSALKEVKELRIRVSSRHLGLASPMFQKMFSGPWREGSGSSNNGAIREVRAADWDAEALLIVLDIMHGQHFSVPKSVSLELLAKIAAVVDYYECHQAVEIYVHGWIVALQNKLPSSYGKECVLWMAISWVFLQVDILQSMVEVSIMTCQGPIETMNLPLPGILSDIIESTRQNTLETILVKLRQLRLTLYNDSSCTPECSYMLLGSLAKQMHKAGIPQEFSYVVVPNYRIRWLTETLTAFTSPTLYRPHSSSPACSCRLGDHLQPALQEGLNCTTNLGLEDVWGQRMKERESQRANSLAVRTLWKTATTSTSLLASL